MEIKPIIRFTRRERRGIIFMVGFMAMIYAIAWIWPMRKYMFTDLSYKDLYIQDTISDKTSETEDQYGYMNETAKPITFQFNPNTISEDSLVLLGFSKLSVRNIASYRSKGGQINSIEKLKKIYGIDTNRVNVLQPFMLFPSRETTDDKITVRRDTFAQNVTPPTKASNKSYTVNPIDINLADSLAWLQLPQIGKYRVSKILEYKEKLGGFRSITQVREVKQIPDSIYQNIEPFLLYSEVPLKKININTCDYKTLVNHPYISGQIANAILKYRDQHGNFDRPENISRIISIKREDGMRIIPYLTTEVITNK